MRTSVEGILYPKDAQTVLKSYQGPVIKPSRLVLLPSVLEVPHTSWERGLERYAGLYEAIKGKTFDRVFVLAPLHKGPISYDDPVMVYTPQTGSIEGSDWKLELSVPKQFEKLVTASDDVCSEEHSLELLAPVLSLLPTVPVTYFLATGSGEVVSSIVKKLCEDFPLSLVLISIDEETQCARMWKEVLQ